MQFLESKGGQQSGNTGQFNNQQQAPQTQAPQQQPNLQNQGQPLDISDDMLPF